MNIEALQDIIKKIANGERLEDKYCDHALSGQWKGHRECHIEPDWLLVYEIINEELIILLLTTGSHSDLF